MFVYHEEISLVVGSSILVVYFPPHMTLLIGTSGS